MNPYLAVAFVFLGCGSNVIFLELIIKQFPGAGNIITFFQFLFIAVEGFLFTTNFGRIKPKIPFRVYFTMVFMFFIVQIVNNYALNFNISVPLHMIFRSGSLMATLILGVVILKRKYTVTKYLSVVMISIGIIICTIASVKNTKIPEKENAEDIYWEYIRWVTGVSMLMFSLFTTSRMGIYQEQVYKQYGKHPSEALFYNHAIPLPGFLFLGTDIYNHIVMFNNSESVVLPNIPLEVPIMWLYLLGNVVTQFVCIKSVFVMTTEFQALTVTLVVTLRKFLSLLFSIWYFQNDFTVAHWIGTVLVFGGTLIFTDAYKIILISKSKVSGKSE